MSVPDSSAIRSWSLAIVGAPVASVAAYALLDPDRALLSKEQPAFLPTVTSLGVLALVLGALQAAPVVSAFLLVVPPAWLITYPYAVDDDSGLAYVALPIFAMLVPCLVVVALGGRRAGRALFRSRATER